MDTPVLIVGAGLVGLTTAIALRQHGVPALVVEKHAGTSIQPKARRFNFRTMEIFRSLGVSTAVYRAAAGLAAHQLMRAGHSLATARPLPPPPHVDFGELAAASPESSCLVAQDLLEPVLLDIARERGVAVRFRTRLVDLDQDTGSVTARLRDLDTGSEHLVHTEYLVAADGSRSTVRDLLGIDRSGRGALHDAVSVYFEADLGALTAGREFNLCQIDNPDVPGAFASVDGRYRWMFMTGPLAPVPADGAELSTADRDRWISLLHKAIGTTDASGAPRAAGSPDVDITVRSVLAWQPTTLVADRFVAGRVVLAGDAAHVMPPYAALGANTGIQDAANLAWKLAAIHDGTAGAGLLATYHAERHAAGTHAVDQSARRSGDLRAVDPALDHPFALVAGYQYPAGAVLPDGSDPQPMDRLTLTGRPGTRVPHLPLAANRSTLDLPGTRLTLLPGPAASGWREAAEKLDVPVADPGPDWPAAAHIRDDGALLVRPDQIVAWRAATAGAAPHDTLTTVYDALLHR